MGRGRARLGGHGKHARGRMKPGTKPRPAGWKMANTKRLRQERNVLAIAQYAFKLATDLPSDEGGGQPLQLVNRAAMELRIKGDATLDAARAIVREQLDKMREANRAEE